MHWGVLSIARIGGCVMEVSANIIWTLNDVGVPSFWLDPTVTSASWGRGGRYLRKYPF